jgi:hypothetical protein
MASEIEALREQIKEMGARFAEMQSDSPRKGR